MICHSNRGWVRAFSGTKNRMSLHFRGKTPLAISCENAVRLWGFLIFQHSNSLRFLPGVPKTESLPTKGVWMLARLIRLLRQYRVTIQCNSRFQTSWNLHCIKAALAARVPQSQGPPESRRWEDLSAKPWGAAEDRQMLRAGRHGHHRLKDKVLQELAFQTNLLLKSIHREAENKPCGAGQSVLHLCLTRSHCRRRSAYCSENASILADCECLTFCKIISFQQPRIRRASWRDSSRFLKSWNMAVRF